MNITVDEQFSFRKYHSLYRCEVLIHSKEFRSRNRPKSIPEIWGITQPFHNLQYCATYKAGYTFWKNMLKTLRLKGAGHRLPKVSLALVTFHYYVHVCGEKAKSLLFENETDSNSSPDYLA